MIVSPISFLLLLPASATICQCAVLLDRRNGARSVTAATACCVGRKVKKRIMFFFFTKITTKKTRDGGRNVVAAAAFYLQHFLSSRFLSIGYVSSVCSWPTRVAADKALLLTSVVAFVLVPPPPPPPPPEPVAVPTEPVGLMGVIGSRLSEPAPPVAVIRVSLGEVAGVRMPRLSYLPFGEPAEDDDDEDDEDEDELEEEEEDAI